MAVQRQAADIGITQSVTNRHPRRSSSVEPLEPLGEKVPVRMEIDFLGKNELVARHFLEPVLEHRTVLLMKDVDRTCTRASGSMPMMFASYASQATPATLTIRRARQALRTESPQRLQTLGAL